MPRASRTVFRSPAAAARLARAARFLQQAGPAGEALVVGASDDAAADLIRVASQPGGAAFGWQRLTLGRLAARLAAAELARRGLVPAAPLALVAVASRVLHRLKDEPALGWLAAALPAPHLPLSVRNTLEEIRLAGVDGGALASACPDIGLLARAFDEELGGLGLADRAAVLLLAQESLAGGATSVRLSRLPLLLLDVPLTTAAERRFVAAFAARAPRVLATVPAGDERTFANLRAALPRATVESQDEPAVPHALQRLQWHLFGEPPPKAAAGDEVVILSASEEGAECLEIARLVRAEASRGTPFDRMAILLRTPARYRPRIEEALRRAGVPSHFAKGTSRPDPSGRAFLALLACADEGLSARRFAEYLSLGELPDAAAAGGPPPAPPAAARWVPPDEELASPRLASSVAEAEAPDVDVESVADDQPVVAGTLRAPRDWERFLVDAAVIGGLDRWERRLDGLRNEWEEELAHVAENEAAAAGMRRALAGLENLRRFALPLIGELAGWPSGARWGEWLDRLSALATRAVRRPERVLALLAELAPLAPVGDVELREVRRVLGPHLSDLALLPSAKRFGRVFVGPVEAARGRAFDVVFIPGAGERMFPRKVRPDPLLLDADRAVLGAELPVERDRIDVERLALRLAVGAAQRRVVLTFPRIDVQTDTPRPVIPSFYGLEVLRAAEGTLPGFEALTRRAAPDGPRLQSGARGVVAPAGAVDETEFDLVVLGALLRRPEEALPGTARFLASVSPHLRRALRRRAQRWGPAWTGADGMVDASAEAAQALAAPAFARRAWSATALENYAVCPYKFFLRAIASLAPREVPERIDRMEPRQRGSLVHEILYRLLTRLEKERLLPVVAARFAQVRAAAEQVVETVTGEWRDRLAPAIERVWRDEVESIRTDLLEWLRRGENSGWKPSLFEVSFGLARRRCGTSLGGPVALDGGLELRGAIDLVETSGRGTVRVTDFKTGRRRVEQGALVDGGRTLQPLLYALAAERIVPDRLIEGGRLDFCTSAGGFSEVVFPLHVLARERVRTVVETIAAAVDGGFLPAAPADKACDWCDYLPVCGPNEALRVAGKQAAALEPLVRLRRLE